ARRGCNFSSSKAAGGAPVGASSYDWHAALYVAVAVFSGPGSISGWVRGCVFAVAERQDATLSPSAGSIRRQGHPGDGGRIQSVLFARRAVAGVLCRCQPEESGRGWRPGADPLQLFWSWGELGGGWNHILSGQESWAIAGCGRWR